METENIFVNCMNDQRLDNGNWKADVKSILYLIQSHNAFIVYLGDAWSWES